MRRYCVFPTCSTSPRKAAGQAFDALLDYVETFTRSARPAMKAAVPRTRDRASKPSHM
jgi:hypothetical protein